jgi:flavin reductase (DIM6/NTAB) family NADH-FMN oxidoreductase RutF
VTIHSSHPFVPPESERDPARRLRGRVGGVVSLWTTISDDSGPVGLTVASLMVAAGDPAHVLALVDPDSDFAETLLRTRVAVVQLLEWEHQRLADAFAGQFPAPGGPFRLADWVDTPWGPRLVGASTWAGVRLAGGEPPEYGWSVLADCLIESVEIGPEGTPLVHRRGRYLKPPT